MAKCSFIDLCKNIKTYDALCLLKFHWKKCNINFIDKATQRIEHIKNTSSIFISVTHDMNYAKQFFNKIIYLKNNKIDYFGDDIEGAINKFTLDNLG